MKSLREIDDEIISHFNARGHNRIIAIRFIDEHQSPTSWASITENELRQLIEQRQEAHRREHR
jgi:hypothetical protein